MKRRAIAVSLLVSLVFLAQREVNQVEKDIDYINAHTLNSRFQVTQNPGKTIRLETKKKLAKQHPIDPEKIFASADYLVKIRIFKLVTIPATRQIIPRDTNSFGSGTIVKCRKYKYCVLTAFHVVNDNSMTYFAEPKDGSPAQMLELIRGTTHYDNALLRFADAKYVPKKTAKLGKSSAMKAGAPIHAMGSNRLGDFWYSVGGHLYTTSKRPNPALKKILADSGLFHPKLLLFNTPIFHGYSGGPLHNKYGEVIGISIGYASLDEEPIYIGSPMDEIRKIQKLLR